MNAQETLSVAADYLDGRPIDDEKAAAGRSLLSGLGALALDDPAARSDLTRLLRIAAGLDRIFQLHSPDMPGLVFFGAEADPKSFGASWGAMRGVSGVGLTPLEAFRRCVGEAAEHLSQHRYETAQATDGDIAAGPAPASLPDGLTALAEWPEHGEVAIDWREAVVLGSETRISVPVDLCWRRNPETRPVAPLFSPGLGCAAGPTKDAAARSAILEVVERDALALWWRGGQRAKPIAAETLARSGIPDFLTRARKAASQRQTWFLDITSDVGIPVVAAVSFGQDGQGFAFGLSAAESIAEALLPACLELGQLELADHVVRAKIAERGEDALNEVDRMHLRRAADVRAHWPILHPIGPPAADVQAADPPAGEGAGDAEAVARLIRTLKAHGHDIVLVDQTNADFQIPVARAFIPTLQPEPATLETARLAQARARSGADAPCPRPPII